MLYLFLYALFNLLLCKAFFARQSKNMISRQDSSIFLDTRDKNCMTHQSTLPHPPLPPAIDKRFQALDSYRRRVGADAHVQTNDRSGQEGPGFHELLGQKTSKQLRLA
jgi:hypothetical protein